MAKRATTGKADRTQFVAGIGVSAGGLDALKAFLAKLPSRLSFTPVIVQHPGENGCGAFSETVAGLTNRTVREIQDKTLLEPNSIYVAPPNTLVTVKHHYLSAAAPESNILLQTPIDAFFDSLAQDRQSDAMGILLAGAESDGTIGLKAISNVGGLTIVQAPESAANNETLGMAMAAGAVDHVLPPGEIPGELSAYIRHLRKFRDNNRRPSLQDEIAAAIPAVAEVLRQHGGHDFQHYKTSTLVRRIQRRMQVLRTSSIDRYIRKLRGDEDECTALFRELLIGVTAFFRDPEAFEVLSQHVIRDLLETVPKGESIRIWVPGCATGEEAYTIAMLCREQMSNLQEPPRVQIFATDIDDRALEIARRGIYPAGIAQHVSEERRKRFFVKRGRHYHVAKELRDLCLFSRHNVISDPPFSHLHLISCRNLLIYLGSHLQMKLIPLFHYALRPGGYLFLGPSESISSHRKLFRTVDAKHRISQSKSVGSTPVPRPADHDRPPHGMRVSEFLLAKDIDLHQLGQQIVVEEFAPEWAIVNDEAQIVTLSDDAGKYLQLTGGAFQNNIIKLARTGLRVGLRAALSEAAKESRRVEYGNLYMRVEGGVQRMMIAVQPLPEWGNDSGLLLVVFHEVGPVANRASLKHEQKDADADSMIEYLERELAATRDNLEQSIQDLEAANEELKSSNEELLSMNEELQSANEELETSKEEIQAGNEALTHAKNNLENLLRSTKIATLFLDNALNVQDFTPAVTEIYNLIDTDIGRPYWHQTHRAIEMPPLPDAAALQQESEPFEDMIELHDGRCLTRRVLPYRTSDGRTDGIVVTFTDVTSLNTALRKLQQREMQAAALADLGRLAMSSTELQPLFDEAVRQVADTLDVDLCKVLELLPGGAEVRLVAGVGWQPGLVGRAVVDTGMNSQAGYTLSSASPVIVEDLRTEERFSGPQLLTDHGVISGLSVIVGPFEDPWGVLGAHTRMRRHFTGDDINFLQAVANILAEAIQRHRVEAERRDREQRLKLVTDAMPVLIAYCDNNRVYRYCNAGYREWFGLQTADVIGKSVVEVLGESAFQAIQPQVERVLKGERVAFQQTLAYRHGPPRTVRVEYIPHFSDDGDVLGYYAMVEDITQRVKAEHDRARLAAIVEHSTDAIFSKDLDGVITSWNAAAEKMYGYTAAEAVGQWVGMLSPEDHQHEIAPIMDHVRRGESIEQLETVLRRKDGSTRDILLTVSPLRGASGEIVGASTIAHDITRRKQAELKLQTLAEQLEQRVAERTAVAEKRARELRQLASQITDAEQRARQRLAQAIHDNLQQILVAAKMRIPLDGETVERDELRKVSELLDEALSTSRTLVSELSPPVLQIGSLADAFSWLARHMHAHHHLQVELELQGRCENDEFDESTKTFLFECARELLFNVVKHAETEQAKLVMRRTARLLEVEVQDSGKGFDPQRAQPESGGFGLFSVCERVAAFGGHVEIDAAPGAGSRIIIAVPMQEEQDQPAERRERTASASADGTRWNDDSPNVRILVADDQEIVREGLVRILAAEAGLEVVGEAADGGEAIEKVINLGPDVVIMDISMPGMNGIEATREIVTRCPDAIVIGLSLHDRDGLGSIMLQAGAAAFLQKDEAGTGLIAAIRAYCPSPADAGNSLDPRPQAQAEET